MKTQRSTMAAAALLTAVALSLTGCGGGSNDPTSSQTTPGRPSDINPTQINAIRQCLKAAGLNQSIPNGAPSGFPSNLPSGAPSNLPSGSPRNLPSNFSGGPGGQFNNPKIQAALKACGIRIPTPPGG